MTINTKFYKPKVAQLTDKEAVFLNKPNAPIIATIMDRRIASRDLGNFGQPYQITYNFSSAIRNNLFSSKSAALSVKSLTSSVKEYGASGWSFRALYEFLCDYHNGGYPFIDTYFERIFKTRPVYQRFLEIYNDVREDIAAEQLDLLQDAPLKNDGTPDMRYAASKRFADLKVWQDPVIKLNCRRVADDIRADIVRCLYSGRIPMCHRPGKSGSTGIRSVSLHTAKIREKLAGMKHPTRLFFASGQLIAHLNIFVELDKGVFRQGAAA